MAEKGTISYTDAAVNSEGKLTHYIIKLDKNEANRIKAMLDSDVIKCNTVFRCLSDTNKEYYVNMLHVRQIAFE